MIYVLPLLTIMVVAMVSMRTTQARLAKVVVTASIPGPASSVFAVISTMNRVPAWQRRPVWLPPTLQISVMTPYGSRRHRSKRPDRNGLRGPEEIFVRQVKNREFAYGSLRKHDLSFESTFRLAPGEGKCRVTWEVIIRAHRIPDILGKRRILATTRASMAHSLQGIQQMVLSRQPAALPPARIFAAPQNQAPAA
jgi:hypothetical protein